MMKVLTSKEAALSMTRTRTTTTDAAALVGAPVIGRIRRTLIASVVAALLYSTLMTGSRGLCADASGEFAARCVQLTLKPSPLLYVVMAVIVLLAIGRVMKAQDESTALRTLDRAAVAVVALVIVALAVSAVWFRVVPIEDFNSGSWSLFSPFPFGLIDVEFTPITRP